MEEPHNEKFERVRDEAEAFYKSVTFVSCPYFHESVVFNAKGLEHIKFHSVRRARDRHDQYIRFKLLPLAPQVLKYSHTLQGVSVRMNFEKEKTHGKWDAVLRSITYYEFVAIINDRRVRVIIKQVEQGPKYFWSIIPFWKVDTVNNRRLMHSGRPETD